MSLVTGLLTHQCDVYRQAFKSDGKGGQEKNGAAALVVSGLRCLIDRRSERQIASMGGAQNVGEFVMYTEIAAKALVRENDIVRNLRKGVVYETETVTGPGSVATTARPEYRIVERLDPNTRGDHLEIGLDKVKGRAQP